MANLGEFPIIFNGLKCSVEFAVLDDESSPARDFFNEELSASDRRRIRSYMEHLADNGEISNSKKFKHERPPFWAFKHKTESKQLARMPCYQNGRRWIVTHGFFKGAQSEWDEAEFTKATEIRNEQLLRERGEKNNG